MFTYSFFEDISEHPSIISLFLPPSSSETFLIVNFTDRVVNNGGVMRDVKWLTLDDVIEDAHTRYSSLVNMALNEIGTGKYLCVVLNESISAIDNNLLSIASVKMLLDACKSFNITVCMTGKTGNESLMDKIKSYSDRYIDLTSMAQGIGRLQQVGRD